MNLFERRDLPRNGIAAPFPVVAEACAVQRPRRFPLGTGLDNQHESNPARFERNFEEVAGSAGWIRFQAQMLTYKRVLKMPFRRSYRFLTNAML
jgi:hypothetical protein